METKRQKMEEHEVYLTYSVWLKTPVGATEDEIIEEAKRLLLDTTEDCVECVDEEVVE